MDIKYENLRSPEVGKLVKKDGMIVIPIGACEEHGRHLPIITDTKIAYDVSIASAEKVKKEIPIAVTPPVWFGYTVAKLKKWPGTITIRPKVLIDLMYDICKSIIDYGITKILIFNGHGNNPGVLDVVVRSIGDDFNVFPGIVNVFGLYNKDLINKRRKSKEGGIGHAGEVETSLMLYLTNYVDMSVANDTDIMKSNLKYCPVDFGSNRKKMLYLSTWHLENSVYGAAGDPTGATKEFGKEIFDESVEKFSDIIKEFYNTQVELEKREGG